MSTNIKINIVEPSTPPSPTPTPAPTPIDPSTTGTTDVSVPDTGLFTHGIGGSEATIIGVAMLLAVVAAVVILYKKHKTQGKATKLVRMVDHTKTIFKSKKRITASLVALALLASAGTLAVLLASSGKSNTNAIEGGTELTVDVDSEDLTIEVGDTPVFAVLPVELTVAEATQAGYILTAYTDNTDLVSTTDDTNIIPMVSTDEGELVALAEDTYGLSLAEPDSQTDKTYTSLSTDQSNPTILKTIDDYSETPANDKTTIYYGFYITPDTPKGTYEGGNITYTALTNPPVATVTFDGNGLYFNDDEADTSNTVRYMVDVPTTQTVAYSHTPNVNRKGEQTPGEMYPVGLNETFVYKFENAAEVNLHLVKMEADGTCGPNSDQYFSFWEGNHPDYTAVNNWESGVKVSGSNGKYIFANGNQYAGMDATVQGDTLTLAYTTSDHRGGSCGNSGYGYYAIITARDADGNDAPYITIGNNAVAGNYAEPTTEQTHKFLGWSTDKNALTGTYASASDFALDPSLTPGDKVTVYAIWDPIIEITYNGNGADSTTDMNNVNQYTTDFTTAGRTVDLLASNYQRAGYGFIGWSEDKDAYTKLTNGEDVTIYGPNETLTIGREMQQRMSQTGKLELNAIWAEVAKDSQGNDLTFQTDDLLTTELADGTTLATKPNGYVAALKDSRDNEVYAVAKLADGNYWMIENLRLDNEAELSLQNTNNPSLPLTNDYNAGTTSNFLSATSNSWCTDYDSAPCYNQSKLNTNNVAVTTASPAFNQNYTNGTHTSDFNTNLYSYGNYYNWYSATAGNGTREISNNQVTAGDICPAGWQLPYGGSGDINNGKGNTSGGFYYLNNLLGNSSNAWRSFPNNFIYSGYWNGSSPSSRGNYGYYWSSTAESYTSSAYYLYLYNSGVSFYSNSKYYGSSVRCVAPIQTIITFDGNGNDGGEMAKQKIASSTTAPLNSNGFVKDGYVFNGWNTERDGSGTSYTDGQDFTTGEGMASVTLYAQWNPTTTITFDGNGNDGGEMARQWIEANTTVALNNNTFTKNGYNFAGWNTERDGSGISYADGQEYTARDGMASVTLYAQWEELPYMQDVANWGNTLSEGDTMQVVDSRDNKTYWVARLADGNIWMTQNLDLDIEAGRTYTSADTDLIGATWTPTSSSATYPTGTTTWNYSDFAPESYDPGDLYWDGNVGSNETLNNGTVTDPSVTSGGTHYHVGNYYNWTAAVAKNSSKYDTAEYIDVNQSICPANWRLPTRSGDKSFQNLVIMQGLTDGTYGNIQDAPVYFVYGGEWRGSSGGVGYRGSYLSSVVLGNVSASELYFVGYGRLDPQKSGDRSMGHYLRCVAR